MMGCGRTAAYREQAACCGRIVAEGDKGRGVSAAEGDYQVRSSVGYSACSWISGGERRGVLSEKSHERERCRCWREIVATSINDG